MGALRRTALTSGVLLIALAWSSAAAAQSDKPSTEGSDPIVVVVAVVLMSVFCIVLATRLKRGTKG